jgi:peptide/nickel transport system permease protein
MTTFIIRRLIQAVFVLIIVTIIVFLAVRLLPGDPILMIISQSDLDAITQEDIEALRHEYGLDRPLTVQYFDWLLNVAHGDFGDSIVLDEPVMKELSRRFPITLHLSLLAFIISILVGIPTGVICAVRRGKWVDTVMTIMANIGITVPIFWLGIMMIYFFSLYLHWLPVYGYTSPFVDFTKSMRQQIMPVICLSVFSIASLSRQTRSSMLEVMQQDYIRTAWSKGFAERYIIFRHALKNSLIPIVTLLGLSFSHVLGGSVLIETVFNIPGLGRMAVNAVFAQDYSVVQGFTFLVAVFILLTNLVVDISYGYLDPRIRYG